MRITFLGTGTSMGVPVIACQCDVCKSEDPHDHRLRTSVLIETDSRRNILIDIGPDFRMQMLRHHVQHLDAILITHAHRDHVGGIDDIRAFNYVQGAKMQLFGNKIALETLKHDYHYIFEPHQYAGLPEADTYNIDGDASFQAAGETIIPIHAMHKNLPVLGYRIGPITYITDANYIDVSELHRIKGTQVLVINALRKRKHFSHFSLPEALEIIESINPRQSYLTHISHEMGLYAAIEQELPDNVYLAYDNLQVLI